MIILIKICDLVKELHTVENIKLDKKIIQKMVLELKIDQQIAQTLMNYKVCTLAFDREDKLIYISL